MRTVDIILFEMREDDVQLMAVKPDGMACMLFPGLWMGKIGAATMPFVVAYNTTLTEDQLVFSLLHEWGHVKHLRTIGITTVDMVEAELRAQLFAFVELVKRGLRGALKFGMNDVELTISKKSSSHMALDEANELLVKTEVWQKAKEFIESTG
jgi:hypothetical protein